VSAVTAAARRLVDIDDVSEMAVARVARKDSIMRNQAQRVRLSTETAVRLLLTTVMGLVLAVMFLLNSQQAGAQSFDQRPSGDQTLSGQELYGPSRDEIVSQLGAQFREVPVAGGIAANGSILEVFASRDGQSWTIIVTRPNGVSSVMAEGSDWSFIAAIRGLRV